MNSMKCQQCDKPVMFQWGEGERVISLCLDCSLKFQQTMEMSTRRNAEMINFLTAEMEFQTGMYGMFPRYPVTNPIIHQGGIKLNNINVKDSVVGAINTGAVQSIIVSLSVMENRGETEIVNTLKELTKQIIEFKEMKEDQKNEILEQLSFISEELSKPKKSQKRSVIKLVLSKIESALSSFSSLLSILEKLRDLLGYDKSV